MSARKSFTKGQLVAVLVRSVWCPRGVYVRPAGTPGVHVVELDGTQIEVSTRDVRARQTGDAQ